ncbi:MAG TPA: phenylalanine--tRNA ligase subunit alpha [Chloroflexota bacterium]|nr:phenylalanine--tRNA ligase subunit alpha [Chloroflexota bacterium]
MDDWQGRIDALREQALAELDKADEHETIEQWRITYLGRRGALTEMLRGLSGLPADQRPAAGQSANEVKRVLELALERQQGAARGKALTKALEEERIDVTLPGRPVSRGGLHPTTIILRQITGFFQSIGYQVVEGPEVELDKYNFEMLNIPANHPARDMWDTLYVNPPEVLMRTHTSPMQARVMEDRVTTARKEGVDPPPVRVIVPGRCYRYEAQDATHEWMFYQVEGLAVDRGITMADLKGTLFAFARHIFGSKVKVRFRCDYFPFVEPGVDMGISTPEIKGGDWLEILGAGMVHPKVLQMAGYDPEKYTGFAFGMGPERIAMLKYGITDIRQFYANDPRFLEQFVS